MSKENMIIYLQLLVNAINDLLLIAFSLEDEYLAKQDTEESPDRSKNTQGKLDNVLFMRKKDKETNTD